MTQIQVTATPTIKGWTCQVEIEEPGATSRHLVEVTHAELRRFGAGRTPQELVQASLRFLLQREPASAILASFSLSEIEQYFPDFPELV